jgi:hypothetical protein
MSTQHREPEQRSNRSGRSARLPAGLRRWHRQEGAVALEFALILPLVLLLLGGVIEFGRVYSQLQVYQGGAREAARCASVQAGGFSDCDVYDTLVTHLGSYAAPSEGDVTIEVIDDSGTYLGSSCTNATVGENVRVRWEQQFDISIAFWKATSVTREIEGVFRCE